MVSPQYIVAKILSHCFTINSSCLLWWWVKMAQEELVGARAAVQRQETALGGAQAKRSGTQVGGYSGHTVLSSDTHILSP